MDIKYYENVGARPVDMEGAKDVKIRWLVSQKEGAPNFAMRMFEISPGGFTPLHTHDWEHEIFILEGEGLAVEGEEEHKVKKGTVIYVVPGELHQFKNTSSDMLKLLCLIPIKKKD